MGEDGWNTQKLEPNVLLHTSKGKAKLLEIIKKQVLTNSVDFVDSISVCTAKHMGSKLCPGKKFIFKIIFTAALAKYQLVRILTMRSWVQFLELSL